MNRIYLFLFAALFSFTANAQNVAINTTGNNGFVITALSAGDQVRLTTAGSPSLVITGDPSGGSLATVKAAIMFIKL